MIVIAVDANNKNVTRSLVAGRCNNNRVSETSDFRYTLLGCFRYEACSLQLLFGLHSALNIPSFSEVESRRKEKQLDQSTGDKEMALELKGGEFIATEALSASTLAGLQNLARRRPLLINGLELHHLDLARLVAETKRTGQPIRPNQIPLLVKG